MKFQDFLATVFGGRTDLAGTLLSTTHCFDEHSVLRQVNSTDSFTVPGHLGSCPLNIMLKWKDVDKFVI